MIQPGEGAFFLPKTTKNSHPFLLGLSNAAISAGSAFLIQILLLLINI